MTARRTDTPFGSLVQRVLTGVIMGIAVLALIGFGDRLGVALLAAVLAGGVAFEMIHLTRCERAFTRNLASMLAAAAFPIAALWGLPGIYVVASALVLAAVTIHVRIGSLRFADSAVAFFSSAYAGFCLSHLVLVRTLDTGLALVLTLIVSVWASDVFAYFVGSAVGRHKLAPRISPKKTWEGLIAGIIGSTAVWVGASRLFDIGVSPAHAIALGAITGLAGVVGDLFASRIKREVGAKDSGSLFPGHGGMLDRYDSMILVSLATYTYLLLVGVAS